MSKRILRYDKKIDEAATYFINKYDKETLLNKYQIEDKKVKKFLTKKLKTPIVHIVYDYANYFIDADSVIMFTKTGLPYIGYEHNVLVDFKIIPRSSFQGGRIDSVKKISERKFYLRAPMPAF